MLQYLILLPDSPVQSSATSHRGSLLLVLVLLVLLLALVLGLEVELESLSAATTFIE